MFPNPSVSMILVWYWDSENMYSAPLSSSILLSPAPRWGKGKWRNLIASSHLKWSVDRQIPHAGHFKWEEAIELLHFAPLSSEEGEGRLEMAFIYLKQPADTQAHRADCLKWEEAILNLPFAPLLWSGWK